MKDFIKPTLSLLAISFIATFCLALVNFITKDTIFERINIDELEQRKQVISGANDFEKIENWENNDSSKLVKEIYIAYDKNNKKIGYVFSATPKGYGGEIKVTVGVSNENKVLGVSIGENNETPGLGTKASEKSFLNQYLNNSTDNPFEVVKRSPSNDNEIQAISGATITSKAVTSAVSASLELSKIINKKE